MIDAAAIDWQFLTRIATIYTQAKSEGGRACIVLPAPPGAYYWGQASKFDGGLWSIRLRLDQTPAELVTTYFHELGHLCGKHPPRLGEGESGIGFHNVHEHGRAGPEGDAWRADFKAYLVELEAEADALGAAMQADFERRRGPLEQYIFRSG